MENKLSRTSTEVSLTTAYENKDKTSINFTRGNTLTSHQYSQKSPAHSLCAPDTEWDSYPNTAPIHRSVYLLLDPCVYMFVCQCVPCHLKWGLQTNRQLYKVYIGHCSESFALFEHPHWWTSQSTESAQVLRPYTTLFIYTVMPKVWYDNLSKYKVLNLTSHQHKHMQWHRSDPDGYMTTELRRN